MLVYKIGDSVAVLNETIRGEIVSISKYKAVIVDEDGFTREYPFDKLVPFKPEKKYNLGDDLDDKEAKLLLKSKVKKSSLEKRFSPHEIDLHYESLTESLTIKSNHEILQKQLTACRSFVQKSMRNKLKRIVIIHGKGEGVLKSEIHLYLTRLNSEQGVRLDFHDAPYHEYGMGGATEVIFY